MIAEAVGLLLIAAGILGLIVWLDRLDAEDLGHVSEDARRRLK